MDPALEHVDSILQTAIKPDEDNPWVAYIGVGGKRLIVVHPDDTISRYRLEKI